MSPKYCVDTSALIDAWVRYYPPDVFPSLWSHLDVIADSGLIIASDEVLHELSTKEDDLHEWAKARPTMFHPLDEQVQTYATEVLTEFPKLVDTRRNRSRADPFVIAVARATSTVVVTGEKSTGTASRPKIPNACAHFGIDCISVMDLLRREGWTFQGSQAITKFRVVSGVSPFAGDVDATCVSSAA